ncbi:MAG: DUF1080 domain-containing protein, partial [Gemmataceae bacterium]|nr:DUF1080 domain-containing protein [Gemmataceae bacterium]
LDGWGWQDTHETLNAFIWGPDGWLYGCHGVFTHSRVGKPGTPDKERVPLNAAVWRYHPTRHVFEVFAHGTSNPWGLDFNDRGQAFVEACVIPHCFHIIQGGRYHRQGGVHFNPYTFADIQTIADHRHYLGPNPHGGNNRSDAAGGGHAHCGLMCYLGGTWPGEYRDQLFMGNIHGRRLNVDNAKPKGSGYVAGHSPDFLLANDAYARFINMRYGPDGNVYLFDWYDKQACHLPNPQAFDRTNGRIYKISHRKVKPVNGVDLAKLRTEELVELQLKDNDWYVRHARRVLQERFAKGDQSFFTQAPLAMADKIAFEHPDETRRLRGLWLLHVHNQLSFERVKKALGDKSPYVRAWTIQLALENGKTSPGLLTLLEGMATSDASPVVRLYLASACDRLPLDQRWTILEGLLAHSEDSGDHNLPLMYWYAVEPLGGESPQKALDLAARAKIPLILQFMVRRIGMPGTPEALALLVDGLNKNKDADTQLTILRGINDALKGRRDLPMPKQWTTAYALLSESKNAEVRSQATALAVIFGDTRAFDALRSMVVAKDADLAQRQSALASLLAAKDKHLPPILQQLVHDPGLRGQALRGLASFDDVKTPAVVLDVYPKLSTEEKRDALGALASRLPYAQALLGAVQKDRIPARDISAEIIRQLRNLGSKELDQRIGEVWGVVRDTPADRVKLIAKYKKVLALAPPADPAHGRALYAKHCAQCHTLFGTGGKVGPDITGANRQDLNYLLENILDPSALIQKEYAAMVVELSDGRFLTGIVKSDTPQTLTILTQNETLTVPQGDVAAKKASDKSMMPDDLVKQVSDLEIRALIAYLQSPGQTPMLATVENAKDFYNGKDLTGWDGDASLWRVDNGEIVGKTSGLKKNEFLRSHMSAQDFRLTLKVKLTPNSENSGVQFRSEVLPGGDVKGLQADIGAGWWGKLYEEHGRGLLWQKSGEDFVKTNEWNDYEIVAQGSKVKTYLNGKLSVDLDDAKIARRGIFALQLHSGGPMEVRFKELRLELLPAK